MMQEVLEELEKMEQFDDHLTESDESPRVKTCDAETNTEAEFVVREVKRRPHHHHIRNSTIRRSQTFSPACRQGPGYVCKVGHSQHTSYFSFQPVLHDWCNKGRGMCYPVCRMVHIKEPLLLIGKSSLCGSSGFPLSLSEWSLTICLTPYNRR